MTRGKEIKFNIHENYNTVSGTVDNKDPKSIYISISAWGNPKLSSEVDYNKVITNLSKDIKTGLNKGVNENNFIKDRSIIDLDMRESGIKFNKRSYMNCEMTLFQKINTGVLPLISEELNEDIKNIINSVLIEAFESSDYFTFTKTKSNS